MQLCGNISGFAAIGYWSRHGSHRRQPSSCWMLRLSVMLLTLGDLHVVGAPPLIVGKCAGWCGFSITYCENSLCADCPRCHSEAALAFENRPYKCEQWCDRHAHWECTGETPEDDRCSGCPWCPSGHGRCNSICSSTRPEQCALDECHACAYCRELPNWLHSLPCPDEQGRFRFCSDWCSDQAGLGTECHRCACSLCEFCWSKEDQLEWIRDGHQEKDFFFNTRARDATWPPLPPPPPPYWKIRANANGGH